MAHIVFINGYFSWNAVALSPHAREIRVRSHHEFVDDSRVMGQTAVKKLPVLEDYTVEISFSQDFANAQVDLTLAADKLAKTPRAFEVRADAGAVGVNNPKYTGTAYIEDYDPIYGAFGEILGTRITLVPSVGGLTRATS